MGKTEDSSSRSLSSTAEWFWKRSMPSFVPHKTLVLSAAPSPNVTVDTALVAATSDASFSSPSSSSPVARRDCRNCTGYLKRALQKGGKPQALLEAMGATVRYSTTSDSSASATTTEIQLVIPNSPSPNQKPEKVGKSAKVATRTSASSLLEKSNEITKRAAGLTQLATSPRDTEAVAADSAEDSSSTSISVNCMPCGTSGPEGGARAYVRGPHPLSIVLCSNRLATGTEVEEALVHELVHAYDVAIRQMDLRECMQLAHSEVRAAREAECSSVASNYFKTRCIRSKATVATCNMFPGTKGRDCVRRVFSQAVADMAPSPSSSSSPPSPSSSKSSSPPTTSTSTSKSSAFASSVPQKALSRRHFRHSAPSAENRDSWDDSGNESSSR